MGYIRFALQAGKWIIGVAAVTLVFGVAVYIDDLSPADPGNLRLLAWAAFFQAYVLLTLPSWRSLKNTISKIASPTDGDTDTERFSSFISFAIIVGFTFILALLVIDYIGHTRAAERTLQEKVWDREDASATQVPATSTPEAEHTNKQSKRSAPTWSEKTGGFLGTFGDFFGGVLNPILTFGTLIALAITVLMQRIQLKEARDEAKRIGAHEQTQAFETTFFNMLNLHAENARHLSFDPVIVRNAEPTKLTLWRKVVYLAVGSPEVPGPVYGRAVFAEVLRSTSRGATQNEPQLEAYRMLQVEHNDVLGHYFRHLYQILNHIDHFKIAGLQVDFNTRKRYSNILRAQLSSHELAVLLLNCSHQMVDDGSFKEKVIRYELLEHLPLYETGEGELRTNGIDPDSESIFFEYFSIQKSQPTCWAPGAFGKNPTAIDYLSEQDSPAWKDKDHLNFPPQAQS